MPVKLKTLAQAYGITRKGIEFYEKKGVIHPAKNNENNYRYLDIDDIYAIFRCKAYQKYGFSVSDAARIGKAYTLEEMEALLAEKRRDLEAELLDKRLSLEVLAMQQLFISWIPESLNRCVLRRNPGYYYIDFYSLSADQPDNPHIAEGGVEQVRRWMAYIPSTASFKTFSFDAEKKLGGEMRVGFGMIAPHAAARGIVPSESVHYIPPQDCVHTIVKSLYGDGDIQSRFAHVWDFMRENHLEMAGDPFMTMVLSVCEDGESKQFENAWFPFRK